MASLRSDRRLFVTADHSRIVEEDDPGAAWLLAGVDGNLGEGDVAKFGLSMVGGRVRYPGGPILPDLPTAKMVEPGENKMAEPPENLKTLRFGAPSDPEVAPPVVAPPVEEVDVVVEIESEETAPPPKE